MITSIKIHNLYSIKDAELRFDKGRYHYLDEYVLNNKISNPIAIYGRNGSGKSSLLNAIRDLIVLLVKSQTASFPFTRNLYYKDETLSSINISFVIDNDSYSYAVATDYSCITREELVVNGVFVMERDSQYYTYNGIKKEIDSKLYPALRTLVANNANENDVTYKAYYYLANIAVISGNNKQAIATSLKGTTFADNIVEKSNDVKKIIETYKSFPIYDVKSRIKDNGKKEYYVHIDTEDSNDVELPLEYISDGMYDQSMMLSTLLTLPKNGVLIVDELENALHPLTIKNFINEVVTRNVQLIFTSHNTNILSYLRPDNIVFVNWKNGMSQYKRLHEIYENIREVNNIEKMYLSSTFDEEIEK